jgi:hypothetical protein
MRPCRRLRYDQKKEGTALDRAFRTDIDSAWARLEFLLRRTAPDRLDQANVTS